MTTTLNKLIENKEIIWDYKRQKKLSKKIGDNLEIYCGERSCPICGYYPEQWTENIETIRSQSIKAGYELAIKDVLSEIKPLILSKENLKVGQDTINLDFNDGVKNCINVIENTYQSLLKEKL